MTPGKQLRRAGTDQQRIFRRPVTRPSAGRHTSVSCTRALLLLALLFACAPLGQALAQTPIEARRPVDVTEHLGDTLPLDLPFVDRQGRAVTLGDYYDSQMPVILVLAYYDCPMLCTVILNGLGSAMTTSGETLVPGRDYRVVTVSIDPSEGPELASAKHDMYTRGMRAADQENWHFLTGKQDDIKKLAAAVGFAYFFDVRTDQFSHPAVLTVSTPRGVISNYLYGTSFKAADFESSLSMARAGRITGVQQHPGEPLPTELVLTDSTGQTFKLGEAIADDRPLILILEHEVEPGEISPFLTGLCRSVRDDWFPVATNYHLLSVSLDPTVSDDYLKARAAAVRAQAGDVAPETWRFARADQATIDRLADRVGIGYLPLEEARYQYSDTLVLVSPGGMISGYMDKTTSNIRDLKMALVDAGEGRIGSVLDRMILSCYHYDPESGDYVLTAMTIMKIGGVLVMIFLGGLLVVLWRRESASDAPDSPPASTTVS